MMRTSKIVIVILIPCLLIVTMLIAYYIQRYQQTVLSNVTQTARDGLNQLAYSEREFVTIRDQLHSLVSLLGHAQSTFDYAQLPTKASKTQLENVFISVAKSQKWFNHIRYVDQDGREKIRVDYSALNQHATAVEATQNYRNTDLFRYARLVNDDQVGAWSTNRLTTLGDTVPAVRLVTPIEIQGDRYGYIILDVDIWDLSNRLKYTLDKALRPKLVSDTGIYLTDLPTNVSASHDDLHSDNLIRHYPLTWQRMKQENSGYQRENQHLLIFTTIEIAANQQWHLVINLTEGQLSDLAERGLNDLFKEGLVVFLIVLMLAVPTVFMALHYYRRSIESKLARAALNGMSAVMIADKSHQVIMVNEEFEKITGLSREWVTGRNMLKVLLCHDGKKRALNILEEVADTHFWEGEVALVRADRQPLTTIMRIQAIFEAGHVSYYITSLVDISERKALENQLRELSEKDSLTHLWNRRKFEQELQLQTQQLQRYPDSYVTSLVLIDIDFFKRVNDEQGHDQGDRVIARVAYILHQHLRGTDFIARIGGEEFAVLMPHTDCGEAESVIERLREAIESDQSLTVTISAGITDLSSDSTRSYKCADIALYESKTLGRNRVSFCLSHDDIA